MLTAAALLAYLNCNGGAYYDIVHGNCLTSQQCAGLGLYAYRNTKLCGKEYVPREGDPNAPTKDGAGLYGCATNWYLVLRSGVATCAQDTSGCTNLFVASTKLACLEKCSDYLSLFSYDVDGTKLCLGYDDCYAKGGYEYSNLCLTPTQCKTKGVYAYLVMKICAAIPPASGGGFDEEQKKKHIYDCKGKYLNVTGTEALCVAKENCNGILLQSKGLCIWESQC